MEANGITLRTLTLSTDDWLLVAADLASVAKRSQDEGSLLRAAKEWGLAAAASEAAGEADIAALFRRFRDWVDA